LSGELFQAAGSGEVTAARRCKARGSDVFGDVFGDVLGDFLGRFPWAMSWGFAASHASIRYPDQQ
jgi:hypothetical protein